MEFNTDKHLDVPNDGGEKSQEEEDLLLHIVPESILIKDEGEPALEMVVVEGDRELSEDIKLEEEMDLKVLGDDEGSASEDQFWDDDEESELNWKVEIDDDEAGYRKETIWQGACSEDIKGRKGKSLEEVAIELKEELKNIYSLLDHGQKKRLRAVMAELREKTRRQKDLKEVVADLRRKNKVLHVGLSRARKSKKELKVQKKSPTEHQRKKLVREFIEKSHGGVWASYIVDSEKDNWKSTLWTEEQILKAIGLRRISKKAYNYMRDNKLCPLPSYPTLLRWSQEHTEWDVPTTGEYMQPSVGEKKNEGKQRFHKDNANHGSDVNPCGRCGKNFIKKAELNEHLGEVHGDVKARKMKCNVCDKWVSTPEKMVGHQNMHMNIKPFNCHFCDKSYRTKGNLQAHRTQNHAQEWKAELGKRTSHGRATSKPCPKCGMLFPLLSGINQHLAEFHEDVKARELQCTTCDKWLGSKLLLQNHMRTHTGERPFKCDFCPKSFFSDKSMTGHRKDRHQEEWEANKEMILEGNKEKEKIKMVTARTNRERNISVNDNGEAPILDETTGMVNDDLFKCGFCDKAYVSKKHMVAHRKEAHNEEWKDEVWRQKAVTYASSNPCPLCGIIFPLQSALNKHLAETHDDLRAKELQCVYCQMWLGSKTLLTDHMRTHTGEHPYKCDFCPKSFTSSKTMGNHRTRMHQKEWVENKEQIMARKRALCLAKRYKGKDRGEVAVLDEATGVIYN